MSATLEQIAASLARIESTLGIVAEIGTRKFSRSLQAKKAGCSVRTLQRRELRARTKLALGRPL